MQFYPMPHYQMRKHALLEFLKKYRGEHKTLLEIGYGSAEIFASYESLGFEVYGFDFSDDAYQYALKQYQDHTKITIYHEESEIRKATYDIVVACEVLEHIEQDNNAISQWVEYLKPEGMMIISVPIHAERWGKSDSEFGHFRRYEKTALIQLLQNNNLKLLDYITYDFPSCFLLDYLRNQRVHRITDKYVDPKSDKMERGSKLSGIARDENPIIRFLSHPIFVTPIIYFQKLFYRTNWGSGALVICQKDKF